MNLKNNILISTLRLSAFALILLASTLSATAATRIAIVSDNSGNLSDLLTAELSSIDGIELLDRSEINRLLKEHKISATAINSKQIFSLGKLLKTDLFVVLESEYKTKKPIGLVIFDANTGIRYWNSALPEGELDKVAGFTAAAVKQALGKRQKAKEGKLKYIALLSIRNADLPRDKDPFCKAIGILLMRQLGNSANFAILERSHLDWLNKERNLPGMEWSNKLLASNMLLDLEVSQEQTKNTGKTSIIGIILINGKPEVKCRLPGEKSSSDLAELLAAKFAEKCKVSIDSFEKINKKIEAKRFLNEYRFFANRWQYKNGHPSIAAYHALLPNVRRNEVILSYSLMSQNCPMDEKGMNKALDYCEYALELGTRWHDKQKPDQYPSFGVSHTVREIFKGKYSKELEARAYNLQLREIRVVKMILQDVYKIKFDVMPKDFKTYSKYTNLVQRFLSSFTSSIDSIREKEIIPVMKKWLSVSEFYIKNSADAKENMMSKTGRTLFGQLIHDHLEYDDFEAMSQQKRKSLIQIFNLMQKHSIPSIKVAGKIGIIKINFHKEAEKAFKKDHEARRQRQGDLWPSMQQKTAKIISKELELLGDNNKFLLEKELCYQMAHYVADKTRELRKKNDFDNASKLLFDFMVSRKELSKTVAIQSLDFYDTQNWDPEKKEYYCPDSKLREIIERANTILSLCKSSDVKILNKTEDRDDTKYFVSAIETETRSTLSEIYKIKPEWNKISYPWTLIKKIKNVRIYAIKRDKIYTVFKEKKKKWIASVSMCDGKIKKICDIKGDIYYRSSGESIIYKDLFLSPPSIINMKTGEVTNIIKNLGHSALKYFDVMGGVLYFVTGNGISSEYGGELIFYSYDLNTNNLSVIAGSAIKSKPSPFLNIRNCGNVYGLVADSERGRILIDINFNNRKKRGLTEYKVKEKTWSQVPEKRFRWWSGSFDKKNGKMLLYHSAPGGASCYEFNPENNTIELIYKHINKKQDVSVRYPALNGIAAKITYPFLLTDNFLWSGGYTSPSLGFSRISLKDGKVETFNIFKDPVVYLNISDNKRYLIVYSDSLYILKLKNGEQ